MRRPSAGVPMPLLQRSTSEDRPLRRLWVTAHQDGMPDRRLELGERRARWLLLTTVRQVATPTTWPADRWDLFISGVFATIEDWVRDGFVVHVAGVIEWIDVVAHISRHIERTRRDVALEVA